MSITVIVELSPKPECTDTLKQFLAEALPDTCAYTYADNDCHFSLSVNAVQYQARKNQKETDIVQTHG